MTDETPAVEVPPNLVDLLDRLIEPEAPPAISMVPQTAGWWVLAVVAALALAYGMFRFLAYRRRNAYRHVALAEVQENVENPAAIADILRRCALVAYPRASVASLSGQDWLAFLDRSAQTTDFTQGAGQVVTTAPYARTQSPDPALVKAARNWIRQHKAEGSR